jgi:large subunit ribosomal protein L15
MASVNLEALNIFDDEAVIDTDILKKLGLIKKTLDGVKILGSGELTKKLTIKANAFSATAKQKIEAAGGKAEVI